MPSWLSFKRQKNKSLLQDTHYTAEEDPDHIASKKSRLSRLFHFRRGFTDDDDLEDDTILEEDKDPLNRSAGWYTGESDQFSAEDKASEIERLLKVGNEARCLSQASSGRRSASATVSPSSSTLQYTSNSQQQIDNPTRSSLCQPSISFPYWNDEANGRPQESGPRQSYRRTRSPSNSIYQMEDQSSQCHTNPPRSQSGSRQERRGHHPLDYTEGANLSREPRFSSRQDLDPARRSSAQSYRRRQSRLAFSDNVGVRMIDGLSEKERTRNGKRNEEQQAKAKRRARREGY